MLRMETYNCLPRSLLERIAPAEPHTHDEDGTCVWCGRWDFPGGRASSRPESHKPSCPWLGVRRQLDLLDEPA